MDFEFLKNIESLDKLYAIISSEEQNEASFVRCINYGRGIESLVRYAYSKQFPNFKSATTEMIRLIKNKDFKEFLGRSDYYNKLHFVYLASNNAAFDHDVDNETANLSFECLKELVCLIFSKLKRTQQDEYEEKQIVEYKYVPPSNYVLTEEKTRQLYIDVNLKNAKYKVNNSKDNKGHGRPVANTVCVEIEVHNLPNQSVGFIDYVIYNKVGLPVAVIEAKRTSKSEEEGAQQARDYADALKKELNLKYRPIIYYTNGYTIKIQDRLGYPAREVGNFASMEDLELMIKRQLPGDIDTRKPIKDKTVDENIINRSKLIEAVKEIIDSMNTDGQMRRKGLLVLPCGVGKTRTAVAITKILLKNEWAQNILFLADRNNLVSNALKPFAKYIEGGVSDISAENPNRDMKARVCICTYNSMLNFLNKPEKEFSVGHFDLIIVDEAHRSLFNVYRAIFEYFDSFIIGLTATPSKALDRSTYDILDLDVDKPTFEVKFEEAVNLQYLVSYKAFDKTSILIKNGLKYSELSEKDRQQYEEEFGNKIEDISGSAFKKTISASGYINNTTTIDKMFEDLFANGLRVENGNKIGKTLIFATDHKHAETIVDCFKKKYLHLGDDFCQVIDNQINKNKTRQDNFAKKDSNPQIVVSVDMMDTGVDIPEIVNLVFFKTVLSRIKFDQMWGRGTRTCKDLHVISPTRDYFEGRTKDDTRIECIDKQGFFVFDYCNNFEFFDAHPEGNEPSNSINLNQKIYSVSLDILSCLEDIEYQEQDDYKEYYNNLKNSLMRKIQELDTNRIDVHSKLAYVDKYKEKSSFEHLSDKNKYEIKTNLLRLIDQNTVDDICSKSFDYRIDIIQLSLLDERVDSTAQQVQLRRIASALLKKASIQDIFEKKEILKKMATEEYYKNLDFFNLERLKSEISFLIKYLKGEPELTIITNFNDSIETKKHDTKYNFDDFLTYREKIISYLRKHFGELESVKKILALDILTGNDLLELTNVLTSLKKPDDTDEFGSTEELIIFIRKIIGLDKNTIDKKCASFLNNSNFNKQQRDLLNLIIDFAIRNGNVTEENLVNDEPFCNYELPEMFDNNLDPLFKLLALFKESLKVAA